MHLIASKFFLTKLEMCRLLSHAEAKINVDGTEWKGLQDVVQNAPTRMVSHCWPIVQWLFGGAH